jgi:hypothetical protein
MPKKSGRIHFLERHRRGVGWSALVHETGIQLVHRLLHLRTENRHHHHWPPLVFRISFRPDVATGTSTMSASEMPANSAGGAGNVVSKKACEAAANGIARVRENNY